MTEATGSQAGQQAPADQDRRCRPRPAVPYTVPQPPAAIDAAIWPGVAAVPSGLKAVLAGRAADASSGPPSPAAAGGALPDGTVLGKAPGRARHGGARSCDAPARRLRRPAGRRRPDRLRRVLHGRRLGRRRPRRLPRGLRRPDGDAGPRAAAEAARPLPAPARRAPSATPSRTPAPTSPTTTTCPTSCSRPSSTSTLTLLSRAVPASSGDGRCANVACGRTWPPRSGARSTGCWTRPASRPAPGCWRSAPAGASWPSVPPRRGATVHSDHAVQRAAGAGPRARSPRPATPTAVKVELQGLPRGRRASTTPSFGRDDRGGRLRVLGHLLPDHRPGAGARRQGRPSRRSRCRTTGCWPPATAYTWINKYIFPGGFLPVGRGDRGGHRAAHHAAGRASGSSMGEHYAETLRLLGRALPGRARRASLALGFDEIFLRMWHFYLEYSRAGFALGLPRRPADRASTREDRDDRHDRRPRRRRPTPTGRGVADRARRGARARSSAASCRCGCGRGTAPRPARPTPRSWSCARPTRCAGCSGTRASSAPPRPTSPASSTSTATSTPPSPTPSRSARERGLSGVRPTPRALVDALRTAAGARRPRAAACRRRRRQARLSGRLHSLARDRQRDQPPLRPLQRVLRADPRPAHGLLLRLLRPTTRRTPLEDAQRAKLDLVCRKLGLGRRACGCSTSAAAGARCRCTPPSTSARRSPA